MKIKKSHLRKIVRGELTIAEAKKRGYILSETAPLAGDFLQSDPQMYENTSIDAQIDKFILQADTKDAEADAGGNPAPAQESFLREADEDAAGGDAPPAPPKPVKKMADLMGFVTEIARLVEKSDALLDVKGAIVRRTLNYITKNYDTRQAQDVSRILDANFGIQADAAADSYDDVDVPLASGAGGPPGA